MIKYKNIGTREDVCKFIEKIGKQNIIQICYLRDYEFLNEGITVFYFKEEKKEIKVTEY